MNKSWINLISYLRGSRLLNKQTSLDIFKNTGWLFLGNLISMVTGLLIGVWVARYLGPTLYGSYNYAIAFVALFSPIVSLGLPGILVRNLVREPTNKDHILGSAFGLQFFGSIFAFFVAVGTIKIIHPISHLTEILVIIIAIRLLIMPLGTTFEYWFKSQMQAKYFVIASKIALVLIALVKITLILTNAPVEIFAWSFIVEMTISVGFSIIFYQRTGNNLRLWRIAKKQAKSLLSDSWPLIISGFAVVVYMKIDQVMLGQMVGETELGYYAAAARLSELWLFIPSTIIASVLPTIVRSRENQEPNAYKNRMQFLYDVLAALSYAIVMLVIFIAPWVVRFLYGYEYVKTGSILIVHIWSIVFFSLGMARDSWLIAENAVKYITLITVIGVLINIASNYILIPIYGGLGAAWGTVISQVFVGFLSCLLFRKLWASFGQLSLSLIIPFRPLSLKHSFENIF